MKIFSFIMSLCLALPLGAQSYGELFEGEAAAAMRASVSALSGTDEKASADYVRGQFRTLGLDVLDSTDDSNFGILGPDGDTLACHNAVAYIEGYDKTLKNRYIVVGAPIYGNASGLAVLVRLAGMLRTNSVLLKRSVILAAFGAANIQNAGSWYFINRSFGKDASNVDAMVDLCRLGEVSGGFYAYTASNADMNQVVNNLGATLQPIHPKLVTAEPVISDRRSFYAKEIPGILFTSGDLPKFAHKSEPAPEYGEMEREVEYIYNYIMELVGGEAPAFMPMDVEKKPSDPAAVPWSDCDYKPAFMNNPDPSVFLERWVYVYLKYPQYAIDNGIQGKVLVDFIIDEKGKVGNVKVLKGVHSTLDEAAVKVIEASPDWKPARVRGKRVKCEMSMYVEFRLKRK